MSYPGSAGELGNAESVENSRRVTIYVGISDETESTRFSKRTESSLSLHNFKRAVRRITSGTNVCVERLDKDTCTASLSVAQADADDSKDAIRKDGYLEIKEELQSAGLNAGL